MFWNKKLKELESHIETSNKTNNAVIADFKDELRERESDINNKLGKFENDIEKRFLEFNREITDRYFSTLEKILKVHSETSLITALANQVGQKDLTNLRTTLLKPFLEEKWRMDEVDKGVQTDKNIKTLGQQLVQMRKQLYEDMLKKEREGKDITELKGKISILDLVIGGK